MYIIHNANSAAVSAMHKASAWSVSVNVRSLPSAAMTYGASTKSFGSLLKQRSLPRGITSPSPATSGSSIFAQSSRERANRPTVPPLADSEKAAMWSRDTPATAPSLAEIEAAIHRLNVDRAAGVEGLQAELL